MVEYLIVEATQEHIDEIVASMRQEDADEVWAAWHLTPREAVDNSVAVTRDTKAGLADGKLLCIFGVGERNVVSGIGCPWLLATPLVKEHAMGFLRHAKVYMAKMKREYGILRNWGDVRNTQALRWMKWLGFTVYPAEPYGLDQLPFFRLEVRNV